MANGSSVVADAFREWARVAKPGPAGDEAFFLPKLSEGDVPVGSEIRFDLAE